MNLHTEIDSITFLSERGHVLVASRVCSLLSRGFVTAPEPHQRAPGTGLPANALSPQAHHTQRPCTDSACIRADGKAQIEDDREEEPLNFEEVVDGGDFIGSESAARDYAGKRFALALQGCAHTRSAGGRRSATRQ